MRKRLFLYLFIGFVLVAGNAKAQVYDLQQCIEIALKNNVQLRLQDVTIGNNKNNLVRDYANLLPSLSATGSQSYNAGGRSINPYTNQIVVGQTFRTNQMGLSANWNIFNGLQLQNNVRRDKATLEASKGDLHATENDIKLRIVQAYINILNFQEQVRNAAVQLATTKTQVERTEKLYAAGSVPQVNLLNLKAQLSTDELNQLTQQNNLDIAKLNLSQIMQVPMEESFEVVIPEVPQPSDLILDNGSKEVYQMAEKTQPQIAAGKYRISAASYGISTAYGALAPTLSVSAGLFTNYSSIATQAVSTGQNTPPSIIGYTPDNTPVISSFSQPIFNSQKVSFGDQFDNNLRQGLTISLNVPIFNNLSAQTTIANAKLNKQSAEYTLIQTKNTLRQTIEQAYLDAKLASKSYYATKQQVTNLSEAFRVTDVRFNSGSINAVDYNLAKTNLSKAQTDLTTSKFNYLLRTKVLDFYNGKSIAF